MEKIIKVLVGAYIVISIIALVMCYGFNQKFVGFLFLLFNGVLTFYVFRYREFFKEFFKEPEEEIPEEEIEEIEEIEEEIEEGPEEEEIEEEVPELSTKAKGIAFEFHCASELALQGFKNIDTTPVSGDHGADIICYRNGYKYVVQCKCYTGNVSNKAVQEIYTARGYYEADVAMIMTNSRLTKQAKEEAEQLDIKVMENMEY